jgi:hypothetical protein
MISKCNTCRHQFKVEALIKRKIGDPTAQNKVSVSTCTIFKERDMLLSSAITANYEIVKSEGDVVITSCARYEDKDDTMAQKSIK